MEVDGAHADVLLQRPWLPVSIDGCQLLAKSWFGDTAYHIVLTDMISVWEEKMESRAIESRAQVVLLKHFVLHCKLHFKLN